MAVTACIMPGDTGGQAEDRARWGSPLLLILVFDGVFFLLSARRAAPEMKYSKSERHNWQPRQPCGRRLGLGRRGALATGSINRIRVDGAWHWAETRLQAPAEGLAVVCCFFWQQSAPKGRSFSAYLICLQKMDCVCGTRVSRSHGPTQLLLLPVLLHAVLTPSRCRPSEVDAHQLPLGAAAGQKVTCVKRQGTGEKRCLCDKDMAGTESRGSHGEDPVEALHIKRQGANQMVEATQGAQA